MSNTFTPIRKWLRENGYNDIADAIEEIMQDWHKQGKKTRRNWWEILSGGKNGKPSTINGKTLPVLKAAQVRQGKTVSPNAICRNKIEKPPEIRITNRWPPKDQL